MGGVSMKRGVQTNLISGYFSWCSVRHRDKLVSTVPPDSNILAAMQIVQMCVPLHLAIRRLKQGIITIWKFPRNIILRERKDLVSARGKICLWENLQGDQSSSSDGQATSGPGLLLYVYTTSHLLKFELHVKPPKDGLQQHWVSLFPS